ncbi:alpha/beta fold hydrolase [Amnibacterium sp. CER49]|uniref:alpha/beta fold hydrolase n=1 Tax=Amnibacterium sp. CER49 TaxID=3039161 RepID=UPI0024478722|nr:alpha/beta fold hydrolase [Amnibacterium sp. CER49]MDH2445438.1 alpha/beta fold hydrolase [Amnibacterium sp. CER49]
MTGTTRVVQVDGHRVGLVTAGSGEPLVLLHGIGRDHGDWDAVLPALAERYTVYAIDVEGFGESEAWGPRVTLRSMAAMVRRTLVALGERRPVRIVGNSMGGAVALRMLADDPAAVCALVLISPAGFGADAALGLRLMTLPGLGPLLLRFSVTGAYLRLQALLDGPAALDTAELALRAARRMHRLDARRWYLDVVHDLGRWRGVREEWRREVIAALAAAATPTLVLWGERDVVLPHAHLAAAAAALPHAVTRSLPGLGHSPQIEAPGPTAAMILEFLAGVAPATAAAAALRRTDAAS